MKYYNENDLKALGEGVSKETVAQYALGEIEEWLNALIGSELAAFLQYEFAAEAVWGTDYDACATEFKKHADEERAHMNKLMQAATERDYTINTDMLYLLQHAKPAYKVMDGPKSSDLVAFHFQSEEEAITNYREFYEIVKDKDITLADIIKDIIADEIEHRKDLKKIYSSMSDGENSLVGNSDVYVSFSNLNDRLSKLNFDCYRVKTKEKERLRSDLIRNRARPKLPCNVEVCYFVNEDDKKYIISYSYNPIRNVPDGFKKLDIVKNGIESRKLRLDLESKGYTRYEMR